MSYGLEFEVSVDSELSHADLVERVKTMFPAKVKEKPRSFIAEENLIEIRINELHDIDKASDAEEGYVYMPYRIEVTPFSKSRTEEQQIGLAKRLQEYLEGNGDRAVVCASFEGKL